MDVQESNCYRLVSPKLLLQVNLAILICPAFSFFHGCDLFHSWTHCRCGNVAAILELDENLNKEFRVFEAAPQVCTLTHLQLTNVDKGRKLLMQFFIISSSSNCSMIHNAC